MANINEIREAINIILKKGTKNENITILHCNSEYPTPMQDVNLKAMNNIKEIFNLNIGYSDHTLGIEIPIAAVALGANVIEKHFTLNKKMSGPDHKASLDPKELKQMVKAIRNIEKALGHGRKEPSASEIKNKVIIRKSIIAKKKISKGDVLNEYNITTKRPGNGISPMKWNSIIGTKAARDYLEDDLI